jgi:hypothetical protein
MFINTTSIRNDAIKIVKRYKANINSGLLSFKTRLMKIIVIASIILITIRDNIEETFESLLLVKVTITITMKITKIANETKIL